MVDRGLFLLTAGVGTGKTAMTIAAVEELADEFDDFRCVVVCAGTLKEQWAQQVSQFTGGVEDEDGVWTGGSPCLVIDGPPEKRMRLYHEALASYYRYVVVGYDQVVDDNNVVRTLPAMCVAVDEITTIKNPGALVTQAMRDTFGSTPFRFGLTGTPMENGKPEEQFQLMVFIDDSVLGRFDIFDSTFVKRDKYGGVREYQNLPLFHEMMADCSASIDPDDPQVAKYMPTMKKPRRVLVQFDEESARVYDLMADDLCEELAAAAQSRTGGFDLMAHYSGESQDADTKGRIMSRISCMRMLCAGPEQLVNSAHEYQQQAALQERMNTDAAIHQGDYGPHEEADCPAPPGGHPRPWPTVQKTVGGKKIRVPKPLTGSAYAYGLLNAGELDGLSDAPKIEEVLADVREALAGDCDCCYSLDDADIINKVVVFSYHKHALRVLEDALGAVAVRYDGDMTLKRRNENKRRFQRDPAVRVFLTSDAGGYGVDLPQANHLFNADVPFTAGRVTQRNARIRRSNLDYHSAVHVRNYLIDGSIEVYYADITEVKQQVANAVRTGVGGVKGVIKVTAKGLAQFIRTHEV